ncbi:hypothetical protein N8387_05085 [Polaribacter sp.]|jgi:hypothetical protein|nr:hypothetical protein [Polaribacter sp.]MDC1465043.1 hypothetical protein [Polaribacter sp.]
MKKIKPFIPLIFPILIILIGLLIYKIIGFEPNVYTIIINLGLAFILSPRVKKVDNQTGVKEQITWLFYKKILK